jgi:hypothetical protein
MIQMICSTRPIFIASFSHVGCTRRGRAVHLAPCQLVEEQKKGAKKGVPVGQKPRGGSLERLSPVGFRARSRRGNLPALGYHFAFSHMFTARKSARSRLFYPKSVGVRGFSCLAPHQNISCVQSRSVLYLAVSRRRSLLCYDAYKKQQKVSTHAL